jgi:hypothetical protein
MIGIGRWSMVNYKIILLCPNNNKFMTASKSIRIWYAFISVILWTGIYLTGFSKVHLLIYLPAIGFVFGAITGICPSQMAIFKMFGVKIKETSDH